MAQIDPKKIIQSIKIKITHDDDFDRPKMKYNNDKTKNSFLLKCKFYYIIL